MDLTFKNFDYAGAKNAGFSDEQISDFLAKQSITPKTTAQVADPLNFNTVAQSALEVGEDTMFEGVAAGKMVDEFVQFVLRAGGTLTDGLRQTVQNAAEKNELTKKALWSFLPTNDYQFTEEDAKRFQELTVGDLPEFDREGALNAGFTDEQITKFLETKRRTKVQDIWRDTAKDWKEYTKGATFSNLPIKALDTYYEAIGQRDGWENFKDYINKGVDDTTIAKMFTKLGQGLEQSADVIESYTGIPKEATLAASELALLKVRVPKVITERLGPSDRAVAKETIKKKEEMVGPLGEKYDVTANKNDYLQRRYSFVFGIEKPQLFTKELLPSNKLVSDWINESNRDTLNTTLKNIKNEKELIEATEMTVKNASKIDQTHIIKIMRAVRNELGLPLKGKEGIQSLYNIRDYFEWHKELNYPRPKLTKNEMKIYNEVFKPLGKQHQQLAKKMNKYKLLEKDVIFEKGKNFMSRMRIRPEKSIREMLTGDRARIQDPYAREARSGASGSREFYVAVDKNGKRTPFGYILKDNETIPQGISTWGPKGKNGKAKFDINQELTDLQKIYQTHGSGEKLGPYIIKEATAKEIENASGYIQHVDPLASQLIRINEMKQDIRLHEYNTSVMESPFMKDQTFFPTEKQRIPTQEYTTIKEDIGNINKPLRQYSIKERTAEVLEDAFRTRKESWLTILSNGMVKNMMLNSLPHMHNELIHWYLSRGMMRTFNPKSLVNFRQEMVEAASDVLGRSDFYEALLKENSSMMGTNISNTLYMDKVLNESTKAIFPPKDLKGYAKLTGRSLAEVYSAISDHSNLAMWQVRDILFVQLVKEKMRKDNIDMKEAVFRVEQHMPTYRLPTRVGETPLRALGYLIGKPELGSSMARGLSKVLQNPNVVIFARYKHGMIKSAMNSIKDMYGAKDIRGSRSLKKQVTDGMDSALAMASAMYVIYPMMDYIFKEIFNDNSAVMRRAGFLHVLQTLGYVTDGTKDMKALMQNLLTVNPALMLAGEIAFNKTFYNDQPVYYADDPVGQIGLDIGKKVFSTIPQVSAIATSGDVDGKWFARQIDVKLKGFEGQLKEDRRRLFKEKERLRRETERALGVYDD